MFAKDVERCYT